MPKDGAENRTRILDAAERLVIDNGYAGTSVDQVIAAADTSKGAFFHHFNSKRALADALVQRYVEADIAYLQQALSTIEKGADPGQRLDRFLRFFEDNADELMSEQSSCLYVAVLNERHLLDGATTEPVGQAVIAWREAIADLIRAAAGPRSRADVDALADHVFVTFEGAFVLCRATGDPAHMRRQLGALRLLLSEWVAATAAPPRS